MNVNETTQLNWDLYPNLVSIRVDGDGSCYFHAIAKAFFKPYRTGILDNVPVNKFQIVRNFRNELATRLTQHVVPGDPSTPIVYDTLSEGRLREFGNEVPDYTLEHMIRELKSNCPVDYVYQELISNEINKDIYILDNRTRDVVNVGNPNLFYKGRKSIVLLYLPGHYELIGVENDQVVETLFEPEHPFIFQLRQTIYQKSQKS